jgi:hypothetical protein
MTDWGEGCRLRRPWTRREPFPGGSTPAFLPATVQGRRKRHPSSQRARCDLSDFNRTKVLKLA